MEYVSFELLANGSKLRTFMISRINDWVPLGKTGYPLAFAMNVLAGRKIYLVGSAIH